MSHDHERSRSFRDLCAIGVIRTPFAAAAGTPIQPAYARGKEGKVIVEENYAAALDDIDGFDRLWLIYWMDRVGAFKPRVVPYRDNREHGLFATRSPNRPNPIGLSVVRLVRRQGRVLYVVDVDILDDTPLLDIKPYVPTFDSHPGSTAGWLDTSGMDRKVADGRFHDTASDATTSEKSAMLTYEVLSNGTVVLFPSKSCIETAAKRARHELVAACLEDSESGVCIEEPIELLGHFLETTDFGKLRAQHPELAGGTECRVELRLCKDGTVRWELIRSP
jgi:tRNA (adenine37-N6)-methyltransferase